MDILAISPIDGRYHKNLSELSDYFSEYALIKYRIRVEIEYLIALANTLQFKDLVERQDDLRGVYLTFSTNDAIKVKEIEDMTNHDVKAVEYYIKGQLIELDLPNYTEFVHFGLTSQDINNTATPLLLKDFIENVYNPSLQKLTDVLKDMVDRYVHIPMLARTHGQPATPTTVGKEIQVFIYRIETLHSPHTFTAKFGGATGGFNAHHTAYPDIDWLSFADNFIKEFGMEREQWTTQISNYDGLAGVFHSMIRINGVLEDLCRDFWHYISIEYFKQIPVAGEVGSSTMPHKINPIRFENAEGNLGWASSQFEYLAKKLPISRLQRDLTDSTVTRNIGVPCAHTILAIQSLIGGLNKIDVDIDNITQDLAENWAVVTEAYQVILRRENVPKPYEKLKDISRGGMVTKSSLHVFIDALDISDSVKSELKRITPMNYKGIYPNV